MALVIMGSIGIITYDRTTLIKHWITSDQHFGHANIIKYCNRPFENSIEMDTILLDNINNCVAKDDILWHLGDFTYGRSDISDEQIAERVKHYRSLIKCSNIILILGNHDRVIKRNPSLQKIFLMILPYFVGYIGGRPFTFNHYPLSEEKRKHHQWPPLAFSYNKPDCINLFGHTHNNHTITPYNMCVENHDYKPIRIEDIT